jgi:uncharacterized RmlC-like cupin family protein
VEGYEGKQGLGYDAGVSAQSVGARGLCMHRLVVPPGGRAKAHLLDPPGVDQRARQVLGRVLEG